MPEDTPIPENEMQDELLNAMRRINPIEIDQVAGSAHSVRAEALLQSILSGERKVRAPWWRRRRIVVPIAIGIALATAAAGYAIASKSATRVAFVRCYGQAATSPTSVLTPASGSIDQAKAQCEDLWVSGAFGPSSNPPLIACVTSAGQLAVFPGDSDGLCAQLGLAVALPTSSSARAVASLSAYLNMHISPEMCLSPPSAQHVAEQELSNLGLSGWTVEVSNASPSSTASCASPEIDEQHRVVYIIPVPPTG